jgi:hypothetical protein
MQIIGQIDTLIFSFCILLYTSNIALVTVQTDCRFKLNDY